MPQAVGTLDCPLKIFETNQAHPKRIGSDCAKACMIDLTRRQCLVMRVDLDEVEMTGPLSDDRS